MSFIRDVFSMSKRDWYVLGWISLANFVCQIGMEFHDNGYRYTGAIIGGVAILTAFMAGVSAPKRTET